MADAPPPAAPAPAGATTPPERPPRLGGRVQWVVVVLVIAGALVGLGLTVRAATTGNDATSEALPESVDRLIPASGSEVLRQATVGIDVASGYDADLVINGEEIRTAEDGLVKDLGTGVVQYVPGPGKPVETLAPERNCVLAFVWPQREGRRAAEPVSWCFNAS